MKQLITDMTGLIGFGLLTAGVYLYAGLPASLMLSGCLFEVVNKNWPPS
ncbi:hypothetical protein [Escherichia coli]|nr:hypothetical protein [Escherichia coli]